MTSMVETEDWDELRRLLRSVESDVSSLNADEDSSEKLEDCGRALRSFHTTAAMLGLGPLERAGAGLELYFSQQLVPSKNPEATQAFTFALNTLLEQIDKASNGDGAQMRVDDILCILDMASPNAEVADVAESQPTIKPSEGISDERSIEQVLGISEQSEPSDLSRLEELVDQLGGSLSFGEEEDTQIFQLQFKATPEIIGRLKALLTASDPASVLSAGLDHGDKRLEKVLNTIKEFMICLSTGNVKRVQEILLFLAEQQSQAGLYQEIGMLARELHNSLKTFADSLDPALKEMVEDKLPDSGNRLEHILEITEKAANTTLDHVEKMQKRNQEDQIKFSQLHEILQGLKAIGEEAQKRLVQGNAILADLSSSAMKTHDDLITVLTAQDYQDLTGQVILKIITLLRDLEMKLVAVIRAFGVKIDGGKKHRDEELYGPAHKGKTEALHSQDDVDCLLAECGF